MDDKRLIGTRSGKVVVTAFSHQVGATSVWVCKCDCGNEVLMRRGNILRMNPTTSCGCSKVTHGLSKSGTFKSWDNMVSRCTRPKNKRAHDYIGRGITVCDSWLKFENFLRDMGDRPEGTSLDRINNEAGYSKQNCRWATLKEQMNNTRRNAFVDYKGETKTIAQWADQFAIPQATLRSRLKRGWSLDEAMTKSVDQSRRRSLQAGRRP